MQNTALPIMEHFSTLQGEGKFAGHSAYFIRLALCDVGCVWCDVKESWEIQPNQYHDMAQVHSILDNFKGQIVVVTGGEPTLHNLEALSQCIIDQGKRSHIETAGTNAITGNWDWITLSPKKFKPCLPENFEKASELKVVIYHKSDFKWAEELAAQCHENCSFYLQAEWSKSESITPLIIEYIKNNPKWALSLQSHKYINIP